MAALQGFEVDGEWSAGGGLSRELLPSCSSLRFGSRKYTGSTRSGSRTCSLKPAIDGVAVRVIPPDGAMPGHSDRGSAGR